MRIKTRRIPGCFWEICSDSDGAPASKFLFFIDMTNRIYLSRLVLVLEIASALTHMDSGWRELLFFLLIFVEIKHFKTTEKDHTTLLKINDTTKC